MSYILEALRKSQQERELGRVPTLDTSGIFTEDKEPSKPNHWGLLAVGLASLAVVIALYAAFRVPSPAPAVQGDAIADRSAADASLAPLGATGGDILVPGPVPGAAPVVVPAAPLVEAPGPKRPFQQADAPRSSRSAGSRDRIHSDESGDGFVDLEDELQRQLEAETDLDSDPVPVQSVRDRHPVIPPDLIEDIEAFKQQVRREQGIPAPTKRAVARIPSDPTRLRLSAKEQAQIPAYLMTAHVYDKDPAQRFVVINALKYREGERTREGLWVERIDPEGAVLSYMGNLFFVAR